MQAASTRKSEALFSEELRMLKRKGEACLAPTARYCFDTLCKGNSQVVLESVMKCYYLEPV